MRILTYLMLLMISSLLGQAQDCKYYLIESCMKGNDEISITVNVDVKDKKLLEKEVRFAALKLLIFEGIPNTRYSRGFIKEGYKSTYVQHPSYFQNLYNTTSSDFTSGVEYLTKYKKSENKTTKVKINVKPLLIRRNLETNGILKQMGL